MKPNFDTELSAELLTLVQDTPASKDKFIADFVDVLILSEKKSLRNSGGRLLNSEYIRFFLEHWFKKQGLSHELGRELILPQALLALEWPYHQISEVLGIPDSRLPAKSMRFIERELDGVDAQLGEECALNDTHLIDALLERPWNELGGDVGLEAYKLHRKNCLRCSKLSRETRKLLKMYQARRVRVLPEEVMTLIQKRSVNVIDDLRVFGKKHKFHLGWTALVLMLAVGLFKMKDVVIDWYLPSIPEQVVVSNSPEDMRALVARQEIIKNTPPPHSVNPSTETQPQVEEVKPVPEAKEVPEQLAAEQNVIAAHFPTKPTEITRAKINQSTGASKLAPRGFVRIGLRSPTLDSTSAELLKILGELNVKQEGKYALGAAHLAGRYFHFNLPSSKEGALRKKLRALNFQEATEDFVKSKEFFKSDHTRFIIWIGPSP